MRQLDSKNKDVRIYITFVVADTVIEEYTEVEEVYSLVSTDVLQPR
jgi:hypothetical protein